MRKIPGWVAPGGVRGLVGPNARYQARIEEEARGEGLWPLSPEHWAAIQFVLDYCAAHAKTPVAVKVGRAVGVGPRKLQDLFPAGAVKTTLRLAGLQTPKKELPILAGALLN